MKEFDLFLFLQLVWLNIELQAIRERLRTLDEMSRKPRIWLSREQLRNWYDE
jgi:hypothetical protein